MNKLQQNLFLIDNKHREERNRAKNKNLRVFYGWAKLGKIRKKEAISVIFENDSQREERTERFIKKMQDTVYIRSQTGEEKQDAEHICRMFTEFSVYMDDKRIKGSLDAALHINRIADKNHVSAKVLNEIENKLRDAFLLAHRGYREPGRQLELFTD